MVKKLGTLISKESEVIHSPFNGEKIMGREALSAKIKLEDGSWHEVKLHSYSPFGIEFINKGFNFKQGEPINIRIKLAGDETEFSGLVVTSVHEDNGVRLAGVRTFVKDKLEQSEYLGSDRRSHRRWNCSEDFLPTGTAPNPVRYNDYILFRVEDISKGGLKIITSMRNKFVGIGQRLECTLSLPYVGTVRVDVKVKHVNTTFYRGKEFMVIGLEFLKTDTILLRSLGEYLLNFAKDVSVKSLNSEGFGINSVSKWLDFSYVKTEEEYKEVLDLRLRAYKSVGKVSKDTRAQDMSTEFDTKTTILVAKHNGKIVASVAYVLPNNEQEILYSKYISYPKDFPKITEIGSSWRFCVDKSFRKADTTYSLISYLAWNIIKNNRRYLYTSATKELLDFYRKCGAKKIAIPYNNKSLVTPVDDNIILMDTHEVLRGKGIGPKYWNRLYRPLLEFLLEQEKIKLTPMDAVRIWFYTKIATLLDYK